MDGFNVTSVHSADNSALQYVVEKNSRVCEACDSNNARLAQVLADTFRGIRLIKAVGREER